MDLSLSSSKACSISDLMENGVQRRRARVQKVWPLGAGLGQIDLQGEGIGLEVHSGRFAMVEAPGRQDCILLRPYSYFTASSEHEISLLIRDVGKGTHSLLNASEGAELAVLGPLGNHFPRLSGNGWSIAGGVGAAPFGVSAGGGRGEVLFGARRLAECGFGEALKKAGASVSLATDDGSAGFHGSVVALMEHRLEAGERPDAIHTCGPPAMMAAVAAVSHRFDIPCWLSLEERMGCGIGVCRGCAHPDAQGAWRCICVDGPVYPASEIFAMGGR